MADEPFIQLKQVTKRFAGVVANDHIDLAFHRGEIHSILGENGAGKSTLMNLLSGLFRPDEGEILVNGRSIMFKSSREAIKQGIGMVHQHFMLVNRFTVAENIILGQEPATFGLLHMKKAREKVRQISDAYDFNVHPDDRVENLSVGQQQQVEIMKALYRDISFLILDEPTAVLTPSESQALFEIMRTLSKQGVTIIFITHKLKEVMAIASRITVMRKGAVVTTCLPGETDEEELVSVMIGRKPEKREEKKENPSDRIIFEVSNLNVLNDVGISAIKNFSLSVREGEIVGIAGVQGNGQTELVEALTGNRPVQSGGMVLDGDKMPFSNPRRLIENGFGHVPEDRLKHGLVLSFSVADNQVLCSYYKRPYARSGIRNTKAILENSQKLIREYDIRGTTPHTPSGHLSGGNQQKVILSRELNRELKLLIASQPTRGLDVGAVQSVHERLSDLRETGAGVILVSSDLDEIFSLSDRIAVMYQGEVAGEFLKETVTRELVGNLMGGGKTNLTKDHVSSS
ncbi:MAG: ABC transporter ATP-binding protein [Proteobacteria bacterium]|nr:ABC transporter ATP-binding protein [Pseudomonadota bacterium]